MYKLFLDFNTINCVIFHIILNEAYIICLIFRKNVNAPTKLNKMKIQNSKQYKNSRNGDGEGIRSNRVNTKYNTN